MLPLTNSVKSWNGKVWHLTSIVNIVQILGLQEGIISKMRLLQSKQPYKDISMEGVQHRRHQRQVFNYNLHEYVPLFFNQRNPMMYYLQEKADELVWLEIDTNLLPSQALVTADGNAASEDTKFFLGLSPWNLDWLTLNSDKWSNIPDGKRKRSAELLCLGSVPTDAIIAMHVSNTQQKLALLGYGLPILVNPYMFFR